MSIDDRGFKSALLVALFLSAAPLVTAEPTTPTADDRAVVERLRKAGVVLTETTGVVTGALVKDISDMTEDNFVALGCLKNLKTLNISSKKLNDRTLGLLTGMTALEALLTDSAQFTDAGLAQLTKFPNLKHIAFIHTSLSRNDFTGKGLAALAAMPNLRRLGIGGCKFNDEGMAAVAKLTQLEDLRVGHTYQTEAGNVHLKSLSNLKILWLGQSLQPYANSSNPLSLTEATLKVLVELKSLETLQLSQARYTADTLARLKALPNLKRLTLNNIDIPAADVAKLKAALSNVTVDCKPLSDEDLAKLDKFLKRKKLEENIPIKNAQAGPDQQAVAPITPVLQKYCVGCHSGEKPKGDLALDSLSPDFGANGAAWNKVLERLNEHSMPPKGKPQPSDSEGKTVRDWITSGLKAHQQDRARTQGRALLRRLNRIEYNNTINDLLGTEIKLLNRLPQDGSAYGFDTVDVGLDMAGPTLERYIQAADVALDAALAHGPRPATLKDRFEINETTKEQWSKGKRSDRAFFNLQCLVQSDRVVYFSMLAASPPETWRVLHSARAPTAGRYTYRVKASSYQDQDRLISYLVYAGEVRRGAADARYVGAFDVTEEPSVAEFTVYQNAGDTIRIIPYGVPENWKNGNPRVQPEDFKGAGLGVHWIEVEGPNNPWPPVSYTRLLGQVSLDKGSLADAESILRRLLPKAFRRPVTEDEVKLYVAMVGSSLKQGRTFEEALRLGLKAVLCSPDFLYVKLSPGRLIDFELACRLSYFLWSTMPDDTLLELAAKRPFPK